MKSKKINIKKLLFTLLWIAIGVGSVSLLAASVVHKNAELCSGLKVEISGAEDNFFVDKADITGIVKQICGNNIEGAAIASFDLNKSELTLEKQTWVQNADLFFDNNNLLHVLVHEREPLARIFTVSNQSFYIDSSLRILPLSKKMSAMVPVFTGLPAFGQQTTARDSSLLLSVKQLSVALKKDEFIMAMIDQVDIDSTLNFRLIPKIGNQIINFGAADNIEKKFEKLKSFYKNIIMKAGWNKYSFIDLQFQHQIVARVKGKEDVASDSLRTLQLMDLMAANAKKYSSDSLSRITPDNDATPVDSTLLQQSVERDSEPDADTEEPASKPVPPVVKKLVTAKPVVAAAAKPKVQPAKAAATNVKKPEKTAVKPKTKETEKKKPAVKNPSTEKKAKITMPKKGTNN